MTQVYERNNESNGHDLTNGEFNGIAFYALDAPHDAHYGNNQQ
jgi:hypothetical protein